METDQEHSHLIMLQGPHPEKFFRLSEEDITLGREMQNAIVISDPEVSRKHARLRRTEAGYTIEDLGSTNGTFVNGARITRAVQLADGDRVSLGETIQLVYQERMPARDQTMVAGAGTVTPPLGEVEMPVEPPAEIEVPSQPPVQPAAPPPSQPVEPAEPYEAEVLELPPPFDEPLPAAGTEKEPVAEQEPAPPPAPPFEIERERRPAPPSFDPGVPARIEEPRQMPPPPPYEPPREPAQELAREPGPPVAPPLGQPYRQPQRQEPPPPPPYYEEYEQEPPPPRPKRRRTLLLACGCLLILLACAAVVGLGYLIWNAPFEFFQDPIRNFGSLFESLTMVLMLP